MMISNATRDAVVSFAAIILLAGCATGASMPGQTVPGPSKPNSSSLGPRNGSSTGTSKTVNPPGPAWYKLTFSGAPPYKIRTKVHYRSGVVPVLIAPVNYPGSFYGQLNALLNHTDSNGDYAVYCYCSIVWSYDGAYMSAVTADSYGLLWGITKKGTIWGTYGSTWTPYFFHYTSLALQKPAQPNPNGFLFATSSKSKTNGSKNKGPSGQTLMLFDPAGSWPNGTWKKTGWGAYQVSADPTGKSSDVAALDDNGNVWEIAPTYSHSKFTGYRAVELSDYQCSNNDAITFLQVAVKRGIILGLDYNAYGSSEIAKAVWNYDGTNGCWVEVGSKSGFISIATDGGDDDLLWAVDTKGNVWYAYPY